MHVLGPWRFAAAQRRPKRVGSIKKVNGHGLRGISRGTSAAELRFCSWKSWFRPWFSVCFITAGPITKLFAWGGRRVEDMCYERRRAEACVD